MYVCVCNRVSDREIREAAENGVTSFDDLCAELRVASCCGRCRDCAQRVHSDALAELWRDEPQLAFA